MEKLVRREIMDHLLSRGLLSTKQHGFINGRCTTTQLLSYLDECAGCIVNGNVIDVIYLDFWKAFDTVPHRRLLKKLEGYGIEGDLLHWIKAFLVGTQQVMVNDAKSKPTSVDSGIPQGSVLGPLLFVIYINDILDDIKSSGLLFADDTKIFRMICSKDDADSLQNDINHLEDWSSKWRLSFNTEKCHVLTLGKFENIRYTSHYTICGSQMEHVYTEKDLGVVFDEDLTFEEHISKKVRIANALVGQIRSSFSYLDGDTFKRLYVAFVRPHLEYAQSVWSPNLMKHIKILENVQIRATKLVDGYAKLDYAERLRKLDLPTLSYRRKRGDMIEVYKHFNTYDKQCLSTSFNARNRHTRKHKLQLLERIPKDGCRGKQSNSFYFRVMRIWNELPQRVVEAETINAFKNELDKLWSANMYT